MNCPHCDLPLQPMNVFGDRDDVFGVPTCLTCGYVHESVPHEAEGDMVEFVDPVTPYEPVLWSTARQRRFFAELTQIDPAGGELSTDAEPKPMLIRSSVSFKINPPPTGWIPPVVSEETQQKFGEILQRVWDRLITGAFTDDSKE